MSKEDLLFTMTDRDGKKALWAPMPNGEKYNIWDLSKEELTPSVQSAIISAFNRGREYSRMQVFKSLNNVESFPNEFFEEEK